MGCRVPHKLCAQHCALMGVLIETFETQQSSPNWHDGLAAARAQRNKRLCPAGAAEQVLGRGHVQSENVQALKL